MTWTWVAYTRILQFTSIHVKRLIKGITLLSETIILHYFHWSTIENMSIMKKLCFLIALTVLSYQIIWYHFAAFAYDTSNKNQGTVKTAPNVDTSIPKRFKPMDTTNLNTRLEIMPQNLRKYRNSDQFLVIPAMGLVTPIVELAENNPDFRKALKGDFDYNKYLVWWPTIYPGTASVGQPGNTFIFAHSNYRKNKPGDFKTIFRLTYNIEPNDTILYYKKINWVWTMFTYSVIQSMLVNSDDVRVMLPEEGKQLLTLSACRPIGTAEKRRINRAQLISQTILQYEVAPKNSVDYPTTNDSITATSEQEMIDQVDTNTIIYIPNTANQYSPEQKNKDPIAQIAVNLALITLKMIISQ